MDIRKRIDELRRELRKSECLLEEISLAWSENNHEKYAALATDAALRSELFTCKMRHLLYDFTLTRKSEYLVKAADTLGMSVGRREDIYEITLPGLFPKRKNRPRSELISDTLNFMLDNYRRINPIKRYSSAVVCFVHEYANEIVGTRIRDFDNLEQKQILDVIATFFLIDDGGLHCNTFNMNTIGSEDRTRIFIMPKPRFVSWLNENVVR